MQVAQVRCWCSGLSRRSLLSVGTERDCGGRGAQPALGSEHEQTEPGQGQKNDAGPGEKWLLVQISNAAFLQGTPACLLPVFYSLPVWLLLL